jgi:hypothetical protein
MVYEARGDKRQAAEYYRQALDFVRQHTDEYEPEFEELYLKLRCRSSLATGSAWN